LNQLNFGLTMLTRRVLWLAALLLDTALSARGGGSSSSSDVQLGGSLTIDDRAVELTVDGKELTITMSGPDDHWFGWGFGSKLMQGTYSIIASDAGVLEYLLDQSDWMDSVQTPMSNPMITVVSDEIKKGVRTITMTRSSTTKDGMFTTAGDLEVICARSIPKTAPYNMELSYHGPSVPVDDRVTPTVGSGVLKLSEDGYSDGGSSRGGGGNSGGSRGGGGSSGGSRGGGGGGGSRGGGRGGSELAVGMDGAWAHSQRDLSTLYTVLFASLMLAAGFAAWRLNRWCVGTKAKVQVADDSQPLLSV